MDEYNRQEQLKSIHSARKALTHQKVEEAIKRLIRANENINYNSVASEVSVAKATLYNHSDLRDRIESLRKQQAKVPTQKQLKRAMNENNKDALIESLKRKKKKLEDENK